MTKRFVLDTNTIVSALMFRESVPRHVLDKAITIGNILQSPQTLAELDEVLRRSKFDKYLPEKDRLDFLSTFVLDTVIIMTTQSINECRDPKNNKFLELAVEGKATAIVSGDSDLLSLHPFRGISIYSPRKFLELNNE